MRTLRPSDSSSASCLDSAWCWKSPATRSAVARRARSPAISRRRSLMRSLWGSRAARASSRCLRSLAMWPAWRLSWATRLVISGTSRRPSSTKRDVMRSSSAARWRDVGCSWRTSSAEMSSRISSSRRRRLSTAARILTPRRADAWRASVPSLYPLGCWPGSSTPSASSASSSSRRASSSIWDSSRAASASIWSSTAVSLPTWSRRSGAWEGKSCVSHARLPSSPVTSLVPWSRRSSRRVGSTPRPGKMGLADRSWKRRGTVVATGLGCHAATAATPGGDFTLGGRESTISATTELPTPVEGIADAGRGPVSFAGGPGAPDDPGRLAPATKGSVLLTAEATSAYDAMRRTDAADEDGWSPGAAARPEVAVEGVGPAVWGRC
mmetsp:Transcript_8113/g.23880  ORF Transcript_8113/g.23880 Transcript_8113/m.23880 type:complete len:381 (-) Transcript_8113:209-1351(-)